MLLSQCRRSDTKLLEANNRSPPLYTSLDIRSIIDSYVQRFPSKSLTRHNLTLAHELGVKLNAKFNRLWARKESFLLKVSAKQTARCAQQSMLLWNGARAFRLPPDGAARGEERCGVQDRARG